MKMSSSSQLVKGFRRSLILSSSRCVRHNVGSLLFSGKSSPALLQSSLNPHIRSFSSSDNEGGSAEDLHHMFQKQMMELQEEREHLFGTDHSQDNNNSETTSSHPPSYDNNMILKEEREALYGFTSEERESWGTSGGAKGKLSPSLMQEIELARQQAAASTVESPLTSNNISQHDTINQKTNHQFTHLSSDGTSVHMVDVGNKTVTQRTARAQTRIVFPPEVVQAFQGTATVQDDLVTKKGPIFATAKLAGIMAAKKTSDLIPLCHPLPLDQVQIDIQLVEPHVVLIECQCRVTHKTGVEMEALTGATVAALTIYDMVKAISHNVRIEETVLVSKTGGKRLVEPPQK